MSWEYNFIDHAADIAVEVNGDKIEDLFLAAAFAWQESVIEKRGVKLIDEKEINIGDSSHEELLVHFLDELNYLLLIKKWVLGEINQIDIKKSSDRINLKAFVTGENIDAKRHQLKVEIKAVTFHQIDIKRINNQYSTRIIFDI